MAAVSDDDSHYYYFVDAREVFSHLAIELTDIQSVKVPPGPNLKKFLKRMRRRTMECIQARSDLLAHLGEAPDELYGNSFQDYERMPYDAACQIFLNYNAAINAMATLYPQALGHILEDSNDSLRSKLGGELEYWRAQTKVLVGICSGFVDNREIYDYLPQ